MKNFLGLTLILFLSNLAFTQLVAVSEPIPVATGYGFFHPQIEISDDGQPVVLWTDNGTKNIYFAKHNGIDDFNTPIKLNSGIQQVQAYTWSGADLAVDGSNIYVVFRSNGYETGHVYVVKSDDNGISFGDTVRVDAIADGFGQFPDVAAYQDTVWVTYMKFHEGGHDPQYVVARSIDGGVTFETEVDAGALLGAEACDCCQPEIIVNANRVIVFFRNNDSDIRDIKAVVSYDRGVTFTDTYEVDDHNWNINSCPSTGPDARFMGEDKMLTVYRTEESGQSKISLQEYDLVADSPDGRVSVSATSSTNVNLNYPQLDYKDGTIGVVWEASDNGGDVFFNSSSTGLSGLLPENAVNITAVSMTQNKPDIAIHDGVFHVIYVDGNGVTVKYVQITPSFVNIEELTSTLGVKAFPVPSEDVVHIKFDIAGETNYRLVLTDVNGKIVQEQSGDNNHIVLNKSDFDSGIYFYQLSVGRDIAVGKIVFR